MVGIIVTGHGSFASGIIGGLRLLAGEPELFETVDFTEEDSINTLTEKLDTAVGRLAGCDGIVIYADLTGGSPFNVSIRLKMDYDGEMEVIGGANLPVVLDGFMSRQAITDVSQLARNGLEAGKEAMVLFTASEDDDDEFEE